MAESTPNRDSVPTADSPVILRASPSVVDCGNTITVEWEVAQDYQPGPKDWIGIYSVQQQNKEYITYEWKGKEDKKGTLTFHAPKIYGEYEFRYFQGGSYVHLVRSNRVRVCTYLQFSRRL